MKANWLILPALTLVVVGTTLLSIRAFKQPVLAASPSPMNLRLPSRAVLAESVTGSIHLVDLP